MKEDTLIAIRKKAEHVVAGMDEGPLKVAAFQTILEKLLTDYAPEAQSRRSPTGTGSSVEASASTISGRILSFKEEGFFEAQQSLSQVRRALASRGWHYPLTTLSGAMQRLVRQRELRRERVAADGKSVWMYSNP